MRGARAGAMGHNRRTVGRLQACLLLLGWVSLALAGLAGCALHPGGDALAFVRGNQLWTLQPDGSNAHKIAGGPIVGFAWSPDHHELVLRTAASGNPLPPSDPRLAAPDAPGDLYVTTINGNSPLQISPSLGALSRSDAWWNPDGNRLLYRQYYAGPNTAPAGVTYVESQSDQPLGIASKSLLDTAGIPALSHDGSRVAVVDADGNLRLGAPAASGSIVATGAELRLSSGRLARVLFEPGRNAILFATAASGSQGDTLLLRDLEDGGGTHTLLTTPDLLDVSFSPDGSLLLARTAQQFSVYRVADSHAPVYSWVDDDPGAVAYWSPNSRFVLVQDMHGSQLASLTARTVTPLLVYATPLGPVSAPASGLWHPAAGSPWSADGSGIIFAATSADTWHGARLGTNSGTNDDAGLFVGVIGGDGTPGDATRIDAARDLAPSWSYADPATTFLLPS